MRITSLNLTSARSCPKLQDCNYTSVRGVFVETKLIEALVLDRLSWQEFANCSGADQDLFFPERGASTRKAKAICAACSVKEECLEFAITQGERFGIWGGLSERERRKIRRQRALAAKTRQVS